MCSGKIRVRVGVGVGVGVRARIMYSHGIRLGHAGTQGPPALGLRVTS